MLNSVVCKATETGLNFPKSQKYLRMCLSLLCSYFRNATPPLHCIGLYFRLNLRNTSAILILNITTWNRGLRNTQVISRSRSSFESEVGLDPTVLEDLIPTYSVNELYPVHILTPACLRTVLISSSLLNLGRSKLPVFFRFSDKDVTNCVRSHSCYMLHPFHPSSFDHLNKI